MGQSVPASRPENFRGRKKEIDEILGLIDAACKGAHGIIYLDGIKQVGKTSLLNFVISHFPESLLQVRLSMMGKDFPSTGEVLWTLARETARQALAGAIDLDNFVGAVDKYERRPIQEFRDCLSRVRASKPDHRIVLIIDEVQELIKAIASVGNDSKELDIRVLNAWQAEVEESGLIFILTGSLRFSKVEKYLQHSFFRRVNRIRVGFLDVDPIQEILRLPVQGAGVSYCDEAIDRVWALSRGYASIVQRCGLECLKLLNADGRYLVAPADVEATKNTLLEDARLFQWWWDPDFLGEREASLMRKFLDLQEGKTDRGLDPARLRSEAAELGSEVGVPINNLCDQEILEFDRGKYCIKGELLEEWLARKFRGEEGPPNDVLKYCALVIDHENFFLRMKDTIETRLGPRRLDDKVLKRAVSGIADHVKTYGNLVLPIAVAFWKGPFLPHQLVYKDVNENFEVPFPARFRKDATDDELRRAIYEKVESLVLTNKAHGTVILVAGDGGYVEMVNRLKKQGRRAVVWAWNSGLNPELARAATRFESLDSLVEIEAILQD